MWTELEPWYSSRTAVTAVWGTNLIQILAALAIFDQDDMKKNVNRITATWWNGRFENG